ncbi:hypothetical protein PILCRDRAFT_816150 [Piloderma croceum F 1598]|uniref:Uncharacterized protein n=1 Tax=Piloderma croceum (strain F 1598) TaxID=765440 RepID=A0A0C3FQ25_PILCF|nr:hypothetical protein PILCRDRAFT_816150 [Piloderma croceum F 1598]
MSDSSSLASVVRVEFRTWRKIANGNLLALFHRRFWGKSMEEEEGEWQKTQTQTQTQTQIEGQPDEDEDRYQGKGRTINEDEDEAMDEDEFDDDDDVIPGCYPFSVGIENITVWIRADYIRVYEALQDYYEKATKQSGRTPSAVVTGQPGISKHFWIYYAARRRLAEKKPFIWFYAARYYLFVQEGVYGLPTDWRHADFRYIVWTLVDSDQSQAGVPEVVVPHGTRLFAIYVTSPAINRWSRLHKTTRPIVVTMNPWSRGSIVRVASLLLPEIDVTVIHEIFEELGPTPRLCIEYASDPEKLQHYKMELNRAISNITTEKLEELIRKSSALAIDAVSHKICLINRCDQKNMRSGPLVSPITDSIKSRLSNQFRNLQQAERIRLFKLLERVPGTRATAGIFYEPQAQYLLQQGRRLDLIPMVKLENGRKKRSGTGKRAPRPPWHSSHVYIRNTSLEISRQQALGQQFSVDIRPSKTLEYTDDGLESLEPNVFYIPEKTNQSALDSFILVDDILYIFQMTIGPIHDINRGLIDSADRYHFPSKDKWRSVFIIPPNLILMVPQPWKLALRGLLLYSAVVPAEMAESR